MPAELVEEYRIGCLVGKLLPIIKGQFGVAQVRVLDEVLDSSTPANEQEDGENFAIFAFSDVFKDVGEQSRIVVVGEKATQDALQAFFVFEEVFQGGLGKIATSCVMRVVRQGAAASLPVAICHQLLEFLYVVVVGVIARKEDHGYRAGRTENSERAKRDGTTSKAKSDIGRRGGKRTGERREGRARRSMHGQARGRHKNNNAAGLPPQREGGQLMYCASYLVAKRGSTCRKLRTELLTSFQVVRHQPPHCF